MGIPHENDLKQDKVNDNVTPALGASTTEDEKKQIPIDISTKSFNLVDLPESARIKEEVIDDYFDNNFDEEANLAGQNISNTNQHPSHTKSTTIINMKPEPQHLVSENILSEEFIQDVSSSPADSVNITDPVTDLIESRDRGDYSKGLKTTTEGRSPDVESITDSTQATLHWVIRNSVLNSKTENKEQGFTPEQTSHTPVHRATEVEKNNTENDIELPPEIITQQPVEESSPTIPQDMFH